MRNVDTTSEPTLHNVVKTKKQYYANLNEKDVADNKKLWKTVKPPLSDKLKSNKKITLVEDDKKVAEELNSFFSNVVENLKTPEYSETNPLAEEIAKLILKSMLKYDKHPTVNAVRNLNIRCHFQVARVVNLKLVFTD